MIKINVLAINHGVIFKLVTHSREIVFESNLLIPPGMCSGEEIKILRENETIASGLICWHGEIASYPCFSGLHTIDGIEQYARKLEPEMFRTGDEIDITGPNLSYNTQYAYWMAMSANN